LESALDTNKLYNVQQFTENVHRNQPGGQLFQVCFEKVANASCCGPKFFTVVARKEI